MSSAEICVDQRLSAVQLFFPRSRSSNRHDGPLPAANPRQVASAEVFGQEFDRTGFAGQPFQLGVFSRPDHNNRHRSPTVERSAQVVQTFDGRRSQVEDKHGGGCRLGVEQFVDVGCRATGPHPHIVTGKAAFQLGCPPRPLLKNDHRPFK